MRRVHLEALEVVLADRDMVSFGASRPRAVLVTACCHKGNLVNEQTEIDTEQRAIARARAIAIWGGGIGRNYLLHAKPSGWSSWFSGESWGRPTPASQSAHSPWSSRIASSPSW